MTNKKISSEINLLLEYSRCYFYSSEELYRDSVKKLKKLVSLAKDNKEDKFLKKGGLDSG